jgi:hypothetical protein
MSWLVKIRRDRNPPGGYWYGEKPRLLVSHRGADAASLIPQLKPQCILPMG